MKIGIISYSYILSLAIKKYIDDNQDSFIKDENRFILIKPFKLNKLHTDIGNIMTSTISDINSDMTYIVGECYHYNNWRINLEYDQIKNGKKTLIDNKSSIKYILKERDIKIDELRMNHIFETFFIKYFKNHSNKFFFIKHKNLTENDILYIFNVMFNKEMLNILWTSNDILLKINDLIFNINSDRLDSKYIKSISQLIDNQFKYI